MITSNSTEARANSADVEEYSRRARRWLADNLARRQDSSSDGQVIHRPRPLPGHAGPNEIGYYTDEVMSASRALQRKLFDGGYAGITWPKEYGGQGLSDEFQLAFDAAAEDYILPDFGDIGGATFEVCVPTIVAHASPEFLSEFVPKVLAGEALVCQFFSEPSAGSDLAGIRTTAVRDGDHWVLNGQKIWTTFGQKADYGMCLARTNPDVPKHRGLTWFVVPTDAPGLTMRPIKRNSGSAEFCEEFLDDVVVPDRNRVGDVHDGWRVTQSMLVLERGAGRVQSDGPLEGPGPLAPDLVELARRTGREVDPLVRQILARIHTNDYVARCLVRRIAQIGRTGALNPATAAYGKLFAGTYDPIRARLALEIGSSDAMAWTAGSDAGAKFARDYLNCRLMSIAGGTNEMQRNAIGERALGLPREPSFDKDKPFTQVLEDAKNWRP